MVRAYKKPQQGTSWQQRIALQILFVTLASISGITVFSAWKQASVQAQNNNVARTAQEARQWSEASFPVENFQRYTSPYGYRKSPTTGRVQFHRGLDFAAPLGSYIRNWWGGKVVGLSDHTACGTMVVIQSGEWQHIYCHLKGTVQRTSDGLVMVDRGGGIRLRKGQRVETGRRIGRVGMTGRTTGPHLHWELKYEGEHLDPALVLREMYNQQQAATQ